MILLDHALWSFDQIVFIKNNILLIQYIDFSNDKYNKDLLYNNT